MAKHPPMGKRSNRVGRMPGIFVSMVLLATILSACGDDGVLVTTSDAVTTTAEATTTTTAPAATTTAVPTTAAVPTGTDADERYILESSHLFGDPIYDISIVVGFTDGMADSETGDDSLGAAAFCQGFDVGLYEGHFLVNGPLSSSECETPDRFFADDTFAEAWCSGVVSGIEAYYRDEVFSAISTDRRIGTETSCLADRWWTFVPYEDAAPQAGAPAVLPVDTGTGRLVHLDTGMGSVWASGITTDGVPTVYRVDADGAVAGEYPLADGRADAGTIRLAVGDRFVWVILREALVRLDPATGATDRIPWPGGEDAHPWDVAAGDGAVWVVGNWFVGADTIAHLYRFDTGFTAPAGPSVWMSDTELGPMLVTDTLVALGSVWVLPFGGTDDCELLRIDSTSLETTARIELTAGCDRPHGTVEEAGGYIYVTDASSGLTRKVDPATNAEVDRILTQHGSGLLAIADGTVWVTAVGPPIEIWGYRADDFLAVGLTSLMQIPSGLTATPGAVWVILDEPSELVRLVIDTG